MKQNQIAKYKEYITPNNYILSQIKRPHNVERAVSKYLLSGELCPSTTKAACTAGAANVQADPEESQDPISAGLRKII